MGLWLLGGVIRRAPSRAAAGRALAGLTLPALAILGGWFAWKHAYYGDILPNTFYAKVGSSAPVIRGLRFVFMFVREYGLLPFVLGTCLAARLLVQRAPVMLPLLATIGIWTLYVVKLGGDFMEFRMFVPVLPIGMVAVVQMLSMLQSRRAGAALAAALIGSSAIHARFYHKEIEVESVHLHNGLATDPICGWSTAGRTLGELFRASGEPVLIATRAAGAIPYYSGLPTLDMHGLSDRWIALHGLVDPDAKPGHQRLATLDYLLRMQVNLVVGHPHIEPRSADLPGYPIESFVPRGPGNSIPPHAVLLEVPLNDRYRLILLYLVPNPGIDRIIHERGLRTWEPAPS